MRYLFANFSEEVLAPFSRIVFSAQKLFHLANIISTKHYWRKAPRWSEIRKLKTVVLASKTNQLSLTEFSFVISFVNRILYFWCKISTETFSFGFQYYFWVLNRLKIHGFLNRTIEKAIKVNIVEKLRQKYFETGSTSYLRIAMVEMMYVCMVI